MVVIDSCEIVTLSAMASTCVATILAKVLFTVETKDTLRLNYEDVRICYRQNEQEMGPPLLKLYSEFLDSPFVASPCSATWCSFLKKRVVDEQL
jgi:hypothetical protein